MKLFGTAITGLAVVAIGLTANATPANRVAASRYYGRYIGRKLDNCGLCHRQAAPPRPDVTLAEFPHNAFGVRLVQLRTVNGSTRVRSIEERLEMVAKEDADSDGVDNLTEIITGHSPGDSRDMPNSTERQSSLDKRKQFLESLRGYRWRPFEPVSRPAIPTPKTAGWSVNPIDAFLQVEREKRGLTPATPTSKSALLRRITLDLTGLTPTPNEIRAFESDRDPKAYDKVVARLLASPTYGERWGRHWMDVWRYSDWAGWADGNQIRDSKPHIWRWRDWIVESLNADKGYDRMVKEMLAADEIDPENTDTLRATGFLVRNFKLLSREQWMEDVVGHTSRAFLGITMHCAKCHDHMYEPITQNEYYRMRAVFETHNVRTDRIPGQPNPEKDGLVRAYDADPAAPTWFYPRGDERRPDKSQPMEPGVPSLLGGVYKPSLVSLPKLASFPDRRRFVIDEIIQAADKARIDARAALASAQPSKKEELTIELEVAERKYTTLLAQLDVESKDETNKLDWEASTKSAVMAQRAQAIAEAKLELLRAASGASPAAMARYGKVVEKETAAKRLATARAALDVALAKAKTPVDTKFTPRVEQSYPTKSSGRRSALANWIANSANPLTARVAVNHIWARHFGNGIVPSLDDFGRNGRTATHPALLDWLASELTSHNWSMKHIHRLIVTSRTYQMASLPVTANLQRDPDDTYLWRMPSRRLEAETVRDNVLWASGQLDVTMGGPEIDNKLGLTSKRRSVYLRIAAEKEVEFLRVFDGPSVTECYERKQSVMPQQALAMSNSEMCLARSEDLAKRVTAVAGGDDVKFVDEVFLTTLGRRPTKAEAKESLAFLSHQPNLSASTATSPNPSSTNIRDRARRNLALVLLNHNDFVTVR